VHSSSGIPFPRIEAAASVAADAASACCGGRTHAT
jgi:hypothetical protein